MYYNLTPKTQVDIHRTSRVKGSIVQLVYHIRATEVPGGNRRRRRNNKAQQKTRKIGILKVYNVTRTMT